jgi:glycosyltransferase involved in cell wall biosynthesis
MERPEASDASRRARLTIGLPVYNGERYLAQAIDSLLRQTFTDLVLIVSDNGSTDATEEICRSWTRHDPRVRYHRSNDNRGAAWNFNRVFELADSPYFKWAAHDDLYAPDCVERCIEVLDRNPRAILAYPQSYVIDDDGEITGTYREPANATAARPHERFQAVVRNSGNCHMLFGVVRRDVLRLTQLHGPYPASDVLLIAELALRGELHEVGKPLFYWRDHRRKPQRLHPTDDALAVFYDPRNAGKTSMRHWTHLARYVHTVARVPLPLGERLRCAVVVLKWAVLRLPLLAGELARRFRAGFRRAGAAAAQPRASSGQNA